MDCTTLFSALEERDEDMDVNIIKGEIEQLEVCAKILEDTILGQKYFKDRNDQYIGKSLLKEGFDEEEMVVALDGDGSCVGFAWMIPRGIFHWFPFIHVVAVKKEHHRKGIGKQLMTFIEDLGFKQSDRIFLCVDDFSKEAIELYKSMGYEEVGPIPDLYVPGVVTYLMMKSR